MARYVVSVKDEVFEGYWWAPQITECARVPGVLTVASDGKARLSLVGAFGGNQEWRDGIGIVLGDTLKGEAITLTGAWISSSRTWGFTPVPHKHVVSAERVLQGIHLEDESSPVFVSARVEIENLSVWSDFASYRREPESTDPSAQVLAHDPVEFKYDEYTFRLRHIVGRFDFELTRGGVDIACPTKVVLEIESDEPTALSGFDSVVFSWVDLLSFWARETCALSSIRLVHKDPKVVRTPKIVKNPDGTSSMKPEVGEVQRVVEMRARWSQTPKASPDSEVNPLGFAFSSDGRTHEDWYAAWMALRNRAKQALDMLLSLTYGKNAFLQSDLLVVALGAETMHRGLYPECLAMQPLEFERMLATAIKGLEEDDQARIERSIKNEPSYSDRLRDLAAIPSPKAVEIAVPDIALWSKQLAAARNGLAHGLRKTNQDVQHMYDLAKRTQLLLELIVMAEIGVSAERQESYATEHQTT